MRTYQKGRRFESDVQHYLNSKGFSTIRAPSSGGHLTPVDVVAIKDGLILALELKNHAKKPKLDKRQFSSFKEWCEKAGALGFLAWKSKTKWLFLRLKDIEENSYEDEKWIELHHLLSFLGLD